MIPKQGYSLGKKTERDGVALKPTSVPVVLIQMGIDTFGSMASIISPSDLRGSGLMGYGRNFSDLRTAKKTTAQSLTCAMRDMFFPVTPNTIGERERENLRSNVNIAPRLLKDYAMNGFRQHSAFHSKNTTRCTPPKMAFVRSAEIQKQSNAMTKFAGLPWITAMTA